VYAVKHAKRDDGGCSKIHIPSYLTARCGEMRRNRNPRYP
jgi:hypothetical protein